MLNSIINRKNLINDFAIALEILDLVNYYEEKPIIIEYSMRNRTYQYEPDFLIHFHDNLNMRPYLCHIDTKAELRNNFKKLKKKFKSALYLCKKEGWEFKIITEEYILTEFLDNAKFLMRYKYEYVDQGCYAKMIKTIQDLRLTTPEEFMLTIKNAHFNIRGRCLYALWYGIKIGEINCDITNKLTMKTEIWPTNIF